MSNKKSTSTTSNRKSRSAKPQHAANVTIQDLTVTEEAGAEVRGGVLAGSNQGSTLTAKGIWLWLNGVDPSFADA